MKSFLSRFGALILSVLSGFDRLRFRGCSRLLSNPRGANCSAKGSVTATRITSWSRWLIGHAPNSY